MYVCTENIKLDANEFTLEEALQGPERKRWEQTVKEELKCFQENGAWELGEAPSNTTVVMCG